jgi:hypothetical protein
VTRDPELDAALQRAAPFLGDQPLAARVRALAIRGADALVEDDERRKAAIEGLIRFSLREDDLVDWDLIERHEELDELDTLPEPDG